MPPKLKAGSSALKKLGATKDELDAAFNNAVDELKGLGTPVIFLQHAALGKTNLKYGSSSAVAKQIYKAPEFIKLVKTFVAPQCIQAKIKFNTTKHLHAAFLEATLFGDIDTAKSGLVFKGHLYDKFDFRKSKNAKVKTAFGKMLRELGNKASDLQNAGILKPYLIRVDLEYSWKHQH